MSVMVPSASVIFETEWNEKKTEVIPHDRSRPRSKPTLNGQFGAEDSMSFPYLGLCISESPAEKEQWELL